PFYEDPSGLFLYRDIDGDGTDDLVVPTSEDASYGAAFDSNLMVYNWNAFTPFSDHYNEKTPWLAAKNGPITFFDTPTSFSNSVSLEDATDKGSFVLNFNNYKQNGIMPNSELRKNTLSTRITHQFTDKLSISAYANYNVQTTVGRNSTGYNDNIMSSFRQWWQTNVDVHELRDVYERSGGQNITWNWADPSNLKPIYWDNPYFTRFKNFQSDERNRFIGYAKVDYKINSWLSASGKVTGDMYSELREERRAAGSVAAEFGINRLDETSGYQKYSKMYSEQNYEGILNIKHNFSDSFNFTGLVGGNIQRNRITSTLSSTQGGLIVPGIYSLSNSVAGNPFPLENEIDTGVNSMFASTSFGFKDFLFLDATVRQDIFSVLPKGKNSLNTYSVSGSFVFTKLIDQSWLSFGKLRGGYAESPLDAPPAHSLVDTFVKFDPFGTNQQYSVPSIGNNINLQAVKSNTKEIGLEMQFADRRVGFDVSVYKTLSEGQIFPVPFSSATGYTAKYVNSGSVENKGVELQFNLTPVKSKDFQWDIFVNWAKNENTVVSLAEGIENLQLGSFQGGITINAQVGQPFGSIKGTDFVYLDGQRVVGANGRYQLNTSTNNVIGNITPDWVGGVRNKVTYKNLSLGFLIDMQKGGDIFSLDQSYGLATGLYDITAGLNELGNPVRNTLADGGGVILPGVQADGTPNTVRTPAPDQYGNVSGYRRAPNKAFVYDASFVKLREVNITYALPSTYASKLGLNEMTVGIVGSNLWIISKNLPYADPESGLSSGNISSGYSAGSLPTTRNVGFNVTFKF
ncbi:MAG: SusC/RagA family TonB-linked outer membrane protein, partial [Flavobacterium sp.]